MFNCNKQVQDFFQRRYLIAQYKKVHLELAFIKKQLNPILPYKNNPKITNYMAYQLFADEMSVYLRKVLMLHK